MSISKTWLKHYSTDRREYDPLEQAIADDAAQRTPADYTADEDTILFNQKFNEALHKQEVNDLNERADNCCF